MKKQVKQYFLLISLALFLIPTIVFGQEYSHAEYVAYYGNVVSKMKDFKNNEKILPLLKELKPKGKSEEFKDIEKLDSLDVLLNEVITDIDNRITSLKNLKNVDDKKYRIKENVLNYLTSQNESLKTMLPFLIKIYKYGEDSITKAEKNSVQDYLQKDLLSEKDRVTQLLYKFENLHQISVNELKIYDL